MISLGGGRENESLFWLFWWDGLDIRLEEQGGCFTVKDDGKIVRRITRITAPQKEFDRKDELISLVMEAFSVQGSDHFVTEVTCNIDLENG